MDELRTKLFYEQKNGYDLIGTEERLAVEDYCRGYMDYLDNSRMEREAVDNAIALAEKDETIPAQVGISAAETIRAAGNPNVLLRVYTDNEMTAAGAALGRENTYSFHHVELAVMEDEAYAQWLFSW
jgi:hypothetical protein